MAIFQRVTRIEFSPSRKGYFEILRCGHFGKQQFSKFASVRATIRKCKECSK